MIYTATILTFKVVLTEMKYKMWRPPNPQITGDHPSPHPYSLNCWGYRANFWAESALADYKWRHRSNFLISIWNPQKWGPSRNAEI